MKTTDELLIELADRGAIHELAARYCDYVCRADLDGLVSLFAEDGTCKVEGLEVGSYCKRPRRTQEDRHQPANFSQPKFSRQMAPLHSLEST